MVQAFGGYCGVLGGELMTGNLTRSQCLAVTQRD